MNEVLENHRATFNRISYPVIGEHVTVRASSGSVWVNQTRWNWRRNPSVD